MHDAQRVPLPVAPEVAAGAATYNRRNLAIYDKLVLKFSADYLWQCPAKETLDLYDANLSNNHLDIGVGSGYFLDKCRFPSATPKLTLVDLNADCLAFVSERIRRYSPRTCVANILDPLPADLGPVDSIGLNYVLHCLPGTMASKGVVFGHLRRILSERGVLFGGTVLGRGVPMNWAARLLMKKYNSMGAFSNLSDDLPQLEAALRQHFQTVSIRLVGTVALFTARP